MIPIETIVTFTIASAILSVAPGPDNIFVLTQSALYGRKAGILITLGLCTGLIFHTSAVAIGISAIFHTSVVAFTILKIVGAIYLLYLAWQAFRASNNSVITNSSNIKTKRELYSRGVIMNITNPKISIFFLAFLPQFASQEAGAIAPQIILLGTIFICVALMIFSAIAILAGEIGNWFSKSPKAQIYLNRLAGTIFAGLALKLATSSAHT